MSNEFKEFGQTFSMEHITIALYHPRSNGQEEHFVDTFKRTLWKAKDTPTDKAIQQFLLVNRVTPNKNTPSATMLVLYNCGMIVFILSFFVGYILSFGLVRLWTVRFLVQVSTLARGGCDNHKCHNKNPR